MSGTADDEVIVETRPTGARFYARLTSTIERSLIEHRNWEFRVQLRMLNVMNRPGTFVDCGANIGVHSCAIARHLAGNGRVVAIEPVPQLADRLERNRDLNHITNLDLFRQAVGSTTGTRTIYVPAATDRNQGKSSFYRHEPGLEEKVAVDVVTLDDLLARYDEIRAIKLDVEGAELEILHGATHTLKKWRPHIFLEYNAEAWAAAGATLADLQHLLGRYRYDLVMPSDRDDQIYQIEAVPPDRSSKRFHVPRRH